MTLLIPDDRVRERFDMRACLHHVRAAYHAAATGALVSTNRAVVSLSERARLLTVSGGAAELGALVSLVYTGAPLGVDRRTTRVQRREKIFTVFDPQTGACEAIIGGDYLAWLSTGAVGALAVDLLSRPSASRLALIGAGRQASAALAGIREVRELEHIVVWSRTRRRAEEFVAAHPGPEALVVAGSAREAVSGADIVVTVTTSAEPVVAGEWLLKGTHVNSMGAHYPTQRELDTEAVRRAAIVVDTHAQARAEKGELLLAERDGVDSLGRAVELGALVADPDRAVTLRDRTTMFASSGSPIESLAAARGALDGCRDDASLAQVDLNPSGR